MYLNVHCSIVSAIARTWKQPRCPSADERIRKRRYIYTMEYYSAIKKNTSESVLMRWMKLEQFLKKSYSCHCVELLNTMCSSYGSKDPVIIALYMASGSQVFSTLLITCLQYKLGRKSIAKQEKLRLRFEPVVF